MILQSLINGILAYEPIVYTDTNDRRKMEDLTLKSNLST